MLDGIEANRIIVGAYTDRDGGVCPMLAAHRNGGRTSLASFAKSWDRYTHAGARARPASDRELRTLTTMLEASLAEEGSRSELAAAVKEVKAGRRRRAEAAALAAERERRDTGERERTGELSRRHGWAWLRPFRRFDDYEAALDELGEERPPVEDGGSSRRSRERV